MSISNSTFRHVSVWGWVALLFFVLIQKSFTFQFDNDVCLSIDHVLLFNRCRIWFPYWVKRLTFFLSVSIFVRINRSGHSIFREQGTWGNNLTSIHKCCFFPRAYSVPQRLRSFPISFVEISCPSRNRTLNENISYRTSILHNPSTS